MCNLSTVGKVLLGILLIFSIWAIVSIAAWIYSAFDLNTIPTKIGWDLITSAKYTVGEDCYDRPVYKLDGKVFNLPKSGWNSINYFDSEQRQILEIWQEVPVLKNGVTYNFYRKDYFYYTNYLVEAVDCK